MLVIARSMQELRWEEICQIYEEGFRLRGKQAYPFLTENEQILRTQEDTYIYLQDEFYSQNGAYYAFWVEDGRWICALRMRPYQKGLLLDALETAPAYRNQGFAQKLLREVLLQIPADTCVYSRILRRNKASVRVHLRCGFQKHKPFAVFLDGSFHTDADTYIYNKQ